MPPTGRHWNGLPERTQDLRADNRLWFGKDGDSPPRIKVFLSEVQEGIVPDTWWPHDVAGSNQDSKKEMLDLLPGLEPFRYSQARAALAPRSIDRHQPRRPRPRLLRRLRHHRRRRPQDGPALDHGRAGRALPHPHHSAPAKSHRRRRPRRHHRGGRWHGGGGFRYYRLAPSLLEKDNWGNWVINHDYNAAMLAEALLNPLIMHLMMPKTPGYVVM